MRPTTFIMLGIAAIFGVVAMFAGKTYLDRQARLNAPKPAIAAEPRPARMIVAASQAIAFGAVIEKSNLREIAWPSDAPLNGSFATTAEVLAGEKRYALAAIEANEPVLGGKITGPGQRVTLAGLIGENMKAVSIRSSDSQGVAGLVQPGDRADVIVTRQPQNEEAVSDVIAQNVRVLAVDQTVDMKNDKPVIAKVITVEVPIEQAQRVLLAQMIGQVSLALRRSGETLSPLTARVTPTELISYDADAVTARTGQPARSRATVTVRRGGAKSEDYDVPATKN